MDLLSPSEFLKNTFTNSEFISSKIQALAQCRQSEIFLEELAKTDRRSYDSGCNKRLQNNIYFTAKVIKATKFVSLNQRSYNRMLRKGAIIVSDPYKDQFLSS